MRLSRAFVPTLKEVPKDAVLASHQYLLRGGFMTQVAAGVYDFLPLGKKVLDKIRAIVKQEMDSAGAQEVSLAFVTPAELWEESGRLGKYGKELLRFKDRKGGEFLLGPTHEEMMVDLVRGRINSYKQLPLHLYQMGLKFRDEARPRFGLMRGREFMMKDGYSFHTDSDDLNREFSLIQETYSRILNRLGLDFRIVEADAGAIGGEDSKEFMVIADSGEDTIVICETCEYASNIEAARRAPKVYPTKQSVLEEIHTPTQTTIDELSTSLLVLPSQCIKAVVKRALYDDSSEIVLFMIRGDDELEEVKAANAVTANELVDVDDKELQEAGLVAGFMGPDSEIKTVYDFALKGAKGMACGANKSEYHFTGYNVKDDVTFSDLVAVHEGDSCPNCNAKLLYKKGIEVGHIFQLGTRYSEPLKANFLNEQGKSVPFVMGTYGLGLSRLVAAVIEQNHDDKGCIWSKATAPYEVEIITVKINDDTQMQKSKEIYDELIVIGEDILWDERKERIGFKMKDYELVGIPFAIIVGKDAADDKVELVDRRTLEKRVMSSAEAIAHVVDEGR
jgi:prolyl-tRNA synthetase